MKFNNTRVMNFEGALRGMRNPKESYHLSDSFFGLVDCEYTEADYDIASVWAENEKPEYYDNFGDYEEERIALEDKYDNAINMIGYENDNFKVLERDGSSNISQAARWKCICKHCGNIFTIEGKHLRAGDTASCGCQHSKGERKITQMLINKGCEFSTQYTFPDLIGIGGRRLRFDFAIFLNGQLKHLIEFNGLQHYEKPKGKWGEEWENLIENDKRKVEYCKQHNIPLKIIKYDQDFTILDLI